MENEYSNVLGRCVSFKSVSKASSYSDKRYLGYWFKDDCLTSHRYICQRIMEPTTAPTTAPPLPANCPPGMPFYRF